MTPSQPILLYGGQVRLSFDEVAHSYTVADDAVNDGEPFLVDSVTTILDGALAKPALVQWAANMAVESVAKDWLPGVVSDEIQIAAALRNAKTAHRTVSKEATDIGSLAHDYIERFIRNEKPELPVNEQARKCCEAAQDWMLNHKLQPLDPERKIYSRKYKYAGTLDWPCFVDGHLALVDWKSSKGCYPEYPLQLSAYQNAWQEMGMGEVRYRYVVRLGKVDGAFEVKRFDHRTFKRDLKAFLAAKTIYERLGELNAKLNPKRNSKPSTD